MNQELDKQILRAVVDLAPGEAVGVIRKLIDQESTKARIEELERLESETNGDHTIVYAYLDIRLEHLKKDHPDAS